MIKSFVMLCNRWFSSDKINQNEMGGECGTCGEELSYIQVLVGRPEGNRPLRRPRGRWEDNTKINLLIIK